MVTGSRSMTSETTSLLMPLVIAVCAVAARAEPLIDEADQGQPDAAEDVAVEDQQQAGADEEVGEDAAEVGGEAGRRGAVPRPPPGDRPHDPAAVHREGGQQVEDEDEEVDRWPARRPSPAAPRCRRRSRPAPLCGSSSQPAAPMPIAVSTTTIASVTSGPATATLNSVAGLSDSRSHPRHPAEDPELDAGDADPVAQRRDIAWPSSCRTIEPKKPKALRSGEQERRRGGAALAQHVAVELREPEDDEEEDEEPGPVDRDADPAHVEERDRFAAEHGSNGTGLPGWGFHLTFSVGRLRLSPGGFGEKVQDVPAPPGDPV